ncbi:MAG: S-layer homology domain-containing protein [Clostridia bacterium]|nr:S-layer homology domain-containing protein [Clostridia bacterium]
MKARFLSCLMAAIMILSFVVPVYSSELYPDIILKGHTSLLIPETDKTEYQFTVCYVSADGTFIPTDEASVDVSELPDGVNFDVGTGVATVFDYAEEGDSFTVTVTPPSSQPKLHIKKYTVTLGYNLLINGDFTSLPEGSGWDGQNSSSFTLKNAVLSFDLNESGSATYLLMQENKIPLEKDTLYECSFDIRTFTTDKPYEDPSIHSEAIGESAVVYLTNPHYPEWTTVQVPLRVTENDDFIFTLAITPEDAPIHVSVKNISLKKSVSHPTSIKLLLPQSFSIPKTDFITTPLDIFVLDQEGNPTIADIIYEPLSSSSDVTVEEETITIKSSAAPGEYSFKAYLKRYPEISEVFTIRITDSGIDNGNFESDQSSESWIASGMGEYSIIEDNSNSYAAFAPGSDVGVMYNNAYVSFKAQQSYVFKADLKTKFSDISVFVTFIIEDKDNPENLILCAYFEPDTSWTSYKAVFTPEEDINGRFIVATNIPDGSDEQVLYLDNIEVVSATIAAEHVKIKGNPARGNTLTGSFDFINNFDGESASITNWALSPSADGPYTTLSYSNMSEIEVTEDMEGKYLRFEVTPISLTAGIFGETVYSKPLKIQKKRPNVTYEDPEDEKPSLPEEEKPPRKDRKEYISPIKIPSEPITEHYFTDMHGHWAENAAHILAAAGVVEGYSTGSFAPDKLVTRAEFCAFLMRSLGLEEGIYSGRFSDVSPQSWYAGVVQTIYNCSLISGISENEFAPNAPITREQLITILMRSYNLIKGDSYVVATTLPFSDSEKISPYALTSITKAYSLGLITDTVPSLRPDEPATRAETITYLTGFLSLIGT